MKKLVFLFTALGLLISCSNNGRYLSNEKTRIPQDSLYFKTHYRSNPNLTVSVPDGIDHKALYKFIGHISGDRFFPEHKDNSPEFLRFYPNGAVNNFVITNGMDIKQSRSFDPKFYGSRGIVYTENGIGYTLDLVGRTAPHVSLGINRYYFDSYSRDTLKIRKVDKFGYFIDIYARESFPNDSIAQFKATW